ncbi:MAG: 4Fe-4S dicluster domain-containing protein [Atribacterota bacterium]
MEYAVLPKSFFESFVDVLKSHGTVVAPVAKGERHFVFEEVQNAGDIAIHYIPTILPPKKYFMPQYETLAEYDVREGQKLQPVAEVERLVLFGVHTCDLAGIQCLDVVFSDRPKDPNYLIRKEYITIIGIECNEYCDQYASCGLMGTFLPQGGYDLFFTDLGEYFFVHVGTQKGEEIVDGVALFQHPESNHLQDLKMLRMKKDKIFHPEVSIDRFLLPRMFQEGFEANVWNDVGNRCLSCANCTNVCPTCYCFDVKDVMNLDLTTGKRVRVWDSCQNEPFAKVASGESFRAERSDRKRHRFNRKFSYPVKRYNRFFCTGCGRCSRVCMAKIDLKETITQLAQETGYLRV